MRFLGGELRQLLQPFLQLQRELLIAFLAHWLHVKFHKLILQCELDVAGRTGEAVYTPSFVESRYHIPLNHMAAVVADISKELIVMCLTVSQTLFLIMPVSQEWLLTFGTNKVLNVPLFP